MVPLLVPEYARRTRADRAPNERTPYPSCQAEMVIKTQFVIGHVARWRFHRPHHLGDRYGPGAISQHTCTWSATAPISRTLPPISMQLARMAPNSRGLCCLSIHGARPSSSI